MSQAAVKSSRTGLSLSQPVGGSKKSRPNTPQTATDGISATKTDSRSSTPNVILIDESPTRSKEKRRISNDSGKNRASPRVSVDEAVVVLVDTKKHENGHQKETNGSTNGSHAAVKETETTPKPKKKEEKKPEADKKKEKSKKEASDDEMEPLVVDSEPPAEAPATPKTTGKTPVARVLTPRQGPPSSRTKPFQKAPFEAAASSETGNLSVVSEKSTESSPTVDSSPLLPPTGRVSGRRSTRPIKEIQLTYRSVVNESSSSLNATVGSTIHNDSINTPFYNRKRRDDTDLEHEGFIDSPSKRARIDFSGFLGYVTTPVTMLKQRLSRVGLTSSTPRKLEVEEEGKIADVSAEVTTTTGVEARESQMEVLEDDVDLKEGKELSDAPNEEDNSDIEIKEKSANRSFCNVM